MVGSGLAESPQNSSSSREQVQQVQCHDPKPQRWKRGWPVVVDLLAMSSSSAVLAQCHRLL